VFDIENSPGFLLAKCHKKAFQRFKEKLEPYNLTPPQMAALSFLWKKDGISQVQLGDLMGADRTTVSGIIDRLEKRGLVVRKGSPSDRRSFTLYITEKGKSLQEELSVLAREHNNYLKKCLPEGEGEELVRLLKKLKETL